MVSRAGGFEEVGVRAIVAGVGTYLNDANRVNRATTDLGRGVKQAEASYKSFEQAQVAAQARMRATAEAFSQAGQQAIIMGAGLAAPGTAAIAFAVNFEQAMTKVSTLSGVAAEDIAGLSEEVRRLAVETGQAPTALAEALLAITSTGLRGAEALEVLEASAKASAIGLGSVETVGRTITGILKAYEKQNLTAAQASDILFATVREGGAEADEVAGAFGRVTGIAATFGVTLQDVGAFVATFTRLGVSADEAVTALRGTIVTIFAPTKEANEALAAMGLSAEGLRKTVAEDGLVAALEDIIQASNGDTEALDAVIGNVRALAGVLGTAGSQSEGYKQVLDAITDSLGVQNAAFEQTAETSAFKYQQAIAELKNTLIDLGSNGLPVLNKFLGGVADLAGAFGSLPEGVQTFALAISVIGGSLLIAAGSASIFAGGMLRIVNGVRILTPALIALRTALITTGAAALANPIVLAAVAVAAVAAGAAYLILKNRAEDAADAERRLAEAAEFLTIAETESAASIRDKIAAVEESIAADQRELEILRVYGAFTEENRNRINDLVTSLGTYSSELSVLVRAQEVQNLAEKEGVEGLKALQQQHEAVIQSTRQRIDLLERDAAAAAENAESSKDLRDQTAALLVEKARLTGIILSENDALRIVNTALKVAEANTDDLADAARNVGGATAAAASNLVTLSAKAQALQKSMAGVSASALAAKIIFESLANIQGATFENVLTLIDPGALQRQIAAAGAALKPILDLQDQIEAATGRVTNAAGRLTSEQEAAAARAAREGESEAERAAREAEREAEELARLRQQLAEEEFEYRRRLAERAAEVERQIFQQRLRDIDQFGDLVATALRRQARQVLDEQMAAYDAQREALKTATDQALQEIERRRDAEVEAAEEVRDATIAAIEAEADAREDALQAQIDAIDDAADAEQRTGLVRDIALAFDPQERADAEAALRAFDRGEQIEGLRAQIESVRETARQQIDIARTNAERIIEITRERAEQEADAERELLRIRERVLDDQVEAAREAYERDTDEFRIQSEARSLIAAGEFTKLVALLNAHVPEWRTAGLSYGQQLIEGIRASGVEQYITDLLGKLNQASRGVIGTVGGGTTLPSGQVTPTSPAGGTVGAAAGSVEEANRLAEIAGRQEQGLRAKEGGAPEIVLDQLRQGLVEMGAIPVFRGGLDMGVVQRPILAQLDPGEVVLNRSQQGEYMGRGPVFERGAFEGMFNGATFAGDPRENARAFRREWESMMQREVGRDAFLWGT